MLRGGRAKLKCAGKHTVVGWNPIFQAEFEQDQADDGTLLLLSSWLKEGRRGEQTFIIHTAPLIGLTNQICRVSAGL